MGLPRFPPCARPEPRPLPRVAPARARTTGKTRAVDLADRASTVVGTNAILCRGGHTNAASASRRERGCQDAVAEANGTRQVTYIMALQP